MQRAHRFGRVEVRPTERVLLVDGQAAGVGARAFDLLLAFIERGDRLVTKNELLDVVWPGLVVEENNLAVQISLLRKCLGPHVIVTIPGRGYRFTLSQDVADAQTAGPASPTAVPAVDPARERDAPALPVAPSALLGRDDDLAALDELLQLGALVTVVGASGIGKTSLALAHARRVQARYRDGVAWVGLAPVDESALVVRAIAQAAGLPSVASDDPLPALVEALRPLQLLLVLDNTEHVLGAVRRFVQAVLAKAPGVRVLVTSQAALKLDGERLFRLGPLALPPAAASASEARTHGAVALFAEQARAADRRFVLTDDNVAAVIDLCRHLDGVALAIKLAAARLPVLGLRGLTARLGDRLRILRSANPDVLPRQQALQAALDWSHGLLDAHGQLVFRRLAVCASGFTVDMAAAVVGSDVLDEWAVIDALGELVDRSLVDVEGTAQPRYRLLETARAYALLKLDAAGERPQAHARHAKAVTALMDSAYESFWATADKAWLQSVEPEMDNVRLALAWAGEQQLETAIGLIASAGPVFLLTGQAPEARRYFAALDATASAAPPSPTVARYWLERSRFLWGISSAQMHDCAQRAVTLYRAAGDDRGLYLALRCASGSGAVGAEAAESMLDEMAALERPDWPARLRTQRLIAEVMVLNVLNRLGEARNACENLLSTASAAGLDAVTSVGLLALAATHLALDEPDLALDRVRAFLAFPGVQRGNFVLLVLTTAARAHLTKHDLKEARAVVTRLVAASRSRDWEWFDQYVDVFAQLAAAEGRFEDAARLIGHADAASARFGMRGTMPLKARADAMAGVTATLDAATVARLMDSGRRMDEETICAVTLSTEGLGRRAS